MASPAIRLGFGLGARARVVWNGLYSRTLGAEWWLIQAEGWVLWAELFTSLCLALLALLPGQMFSPRYINIPHPDPKQNRA